MVTAYILIVTEVGKEYDVVRKLKEMKSTVEVAVVYGEYDAFVKFMVGNLKELDAIVTEIRKIPGIIRTITLISS
jgi:DNA-binding Lrp family transcriptional regulator